MRNVSFMSLLLLSIAPNRTRQRRREAQVV